jgi:putative membrane protein
MMMYGGGWVVGIVILLVVLLAVGAMVIGGIWLIGRNTASDRRQSGRSGDEPLEILRRRYASGEITHEEYDTMRERLSQ